MRHLVMYENSIGAGEEKPKHPVEISGYWLGETPVTNWQFLERIRPTNPGW